VKHALIIPVYQNEASLPDLLDVVTTISSEMDNELTAVFVVDGSPDQSYPLLRDMLPNQSFPSKLLVLSRNFGSFAAIRAGLEAVEASDYAVMAADLQEPGELLSRFFRVLESDESDVVLGRRVAREDPFLSRITAQLFWNLYCRFIQPEMPKGGIDVFGCSRKVRDTLLSLEEGNSSLVGLLVWVGYRQQEIPYTRIERAQGKSGWTLRKKFAYMLDSAFAFSRLPLVLMFATGFFGLITSLVVGVIVFASWSSGLTPVLGYTPIMLSIFFCTSLILIGLGIVGAYVWRTFENTKRRPLSIVQTVESFPGEKSA
jgi:glycosyltransferase involved in cell wall biosynthesis